MRIIRVGPGASDRSGRLDTRGLLGALVFGWEEYDATVPIGSWGTALAASLVHVVATTAYLPFVCGALGLVHLDRRRRAAP